MKQAFDRLIEDSNNAICNGDPALARALRHVAAALGLQIEHDAEVAMGAQKLMDTIESSFPPIDALRDRSRERNVFNESVSRSAAGLAAIDPGGPPPVHPAPEPALFQALGRVLEAASAEADNLREDDPADAADLDAAIRFVQTWGDRGEKLGRAFKDVVG